MKKLAICRMRLMGVSEMQKRYLIVLLMCVASLSFAQEAGTCWQRSVLPWFKFKVGSEKADTKMPGSPTEAIKQLDKKLNDYRTGDNLTLAEKEHNRQVKNDILHTTFDVRELCRISLGRHWNNLATKQQNEFVNLMTDLLMEKGILSKEQGKQKARSDSVYTVVYKGDKYLDPKRTRALTKTLVVIKGQDTRAGLDYKLVVQDGEWKIYDVIVDGASLMENYKYQFDSLITKNGYPDLVSRMQRKLNSFKSDQG